MYILVSNLGKEQGAGGIFTQPRSQGLSMTREVKEKDPGNEVNLYWSPGCPGDHASCNASCNMIG